MESAIAGGLATLYAVAAIPVVHTAAGGATRTVRAIRRSPDEIMGGFTQVVEPSMTFEVASIDAINIFMGDTMTINGKVYRVAASPIYADPLRLVAEIHCDAS